MCKWKILALNIESVENATLNEAETEMMLEGWR